jgi:hypothetical protein
MIFGVDSHRSTLRVAGVDELGRVIVATSVRTGRVSIEDILRAAWLAGMAPCPWGRLPRRHRVEPSMWSG